MKDRKERLEKELEILNQKVKVLEMIEKHRLDNTRLIEALDNDLFVRCIFEIGNLSYGLHLNDKKKGSSEIMKKMIRYEYIPKEDESILWVHFPTNSKSKSIVCRLQKGIKYSSDKVKPPSESDVQGYPSFTVKSEEDIEDLISCINEYMTKILKVYP